MTTMAVPFDTLAFVKELETAGVPAPQAEAQARALSNVLQKVEEIRARELATKGDIVVLRGEIAEVKRDVKELEAKMDSRFKELELRMVIKLGAMIIVAVGVMMTSLRIWPLPVHYVPQAAQEMRTTP